MAREVHRPSIVTLQETCTPASTVDNAQLIAHHLIYNPLGQVTRDHGGDLRGFQ